MKEIIFLVADKNMEQLLRGLLPRISRVEGLPEFAFEIIVHPRRDAGVLNEAEDFLRPYTGQHKYALAILDLEGCGRESKGRLDIETIIEDKLIGSGWDQGAMGAICIAPELENWIWVAETNMQSAMGWNHSLKLFQWLQKEGDANPLDAKPPRPKELFEKALKFVKTPRSSALYKNIAASSSYKHCKDPAFLKLIQKIRVFLA
jgi:hypothetical protein